jgi:hypothetical protein
MNKRISIELIDETKERQKGQEFSKLASEKVSGVCVHVHSAVSEGIPPRSSDVPKVQKTRLPPVIIYTT